MTLAIHPETKVGALLEAYPELEAVLLSMAPDFKKLRNPVLKRTVEQSATLHQAAGIGGVPVHELVHRLSQAAGQPAAASDEPSWLGAVVISEENDIDGGALLAQGIHPLGMVRQRVSALASGQTLRLRTPFLPAPLIDTLRSDRVEVYSTQDSPNQHLTYFHVR